MNGAEINGAASTTATVLRRRAAARELWLPVSGVSMGSRFRPGAHVLVRASNGRPRIGEIWAFVDADDRLVVHRCVWNRSPGALRFRGDAVCSLDPPVALGDLVGRVTEVDDGIDRWSPRLWHAAHPTVRALARALRVRLRRFRRFATSSSRQGTR